MLGSTREQTQVVNRTLLASTISALLAGGGAAQAQQPPQNPQGLEEITVTGSRIVRRDLDAGSPIVTIDAARFENSSTISIESVLNQMPQFVPEGTQFDQGIQAGPTLSLGIGSVNLRGIGPNRTLVLIDGRRAQPANAALLIDVNTIPSAAIERVETITGGASAVYGADAMAGVVNFILKKDFEGVDMDFQSGMTSQHDGQETRFTSLLGVNSGDGKSNVMLGVEWYNRGQVALKDRSFYSNGWFDKGSDAGGFIQPPGLSPATNNFLPSQAGIDQMFSANPTQYAGYFPCNGWATELDGKAGITFADCAAGAKAAGPSRWAVQNNSEIYFNPDGSPFVLAGGHGYNGPIDTVDSHTPEGYGYSGMRLQPNGNLGQVSYAGQASSPLTRRSLFGRATHQLNENLTAFAQANYSSVEVTTTGGYPPAITVWAAPIPLVDAAGQPIARQIPAALQQLLTTRFTPARTATATTPAVPAGAPGSAATQPWSLFRVLDFLGGPVTTRSSSDVFQILAGVEGKFSNRDWTWEAYVSSGQTNISNFFDNMPSLQRYQYLVSQANWGKGTFTQGRNYFTTCTTGLPILSAAFGSTGVSADCLEGLASKARSLTKLQQDIGEFNLQGKITDMKAGELRFALGASTRKNSFRFDPGETNDRESVVEQPISIFASNNTQGGTKANEIYGELLVPVTKKFDLEFGIRESEYADSQIGKTDTSKALFTFKATESITLRGGFQAAERAPNTAELFQGVSLLVVPFAPSDPCSFTTTAAWGNVTPSSAGYWASTGAAAPAPVNPNYLKVQQLCVDITNNSDGLASNDNQAIYTVGGSANTFARPGNPFFPLEIELRKGNTGVKPEKGQTFTLGVVFQGPGRFDNLTASFDFYDVKITDAIAPLNSLFVYQQCFNSNGTSNPTYAFNDPGGYCKKILRNVSTTERASVDAPFANAGVLSTTGLDVAVNWTKDIGMGSFFINSLVTFLSKYDIQDAPSEPVNHVKDTFDQGGQFKYKLTNTFGYNFGGGKANIGLQWRYLPSIRDESASRNPATLVYPVKSYQSFNVFAGYTINDKLNLRMGIDNLMDEQPNIVGARAGDNNAEVTRPDYYDVLGRRAYVGIKMSF